MVLVFPRTGSDLSFLRDKFILEETPDIKFPDLSLHRDKFILEETPDIKFPDLSLLIDKFILKETTGIRFWMLLVVTILDNKGPLKIGRNPFSGLLVIRRDGEERFFEEGKEHPSKNLSSRSFEEGILFETAGHKMRRDKMAMEEDSP